MRVISVIEDVVNKEKLVNLLQKEALSCSPYDYERIRFIFDVISKLNPDDRIAKTAFMILDILSCYNRKNKCDFTESNALVNQNYAGVRSLETFRQKFPQCDHRLPYHKLVMEPWSVLEDEIDMDSLTRLLPLAIPLGINKDQFYHTVIKKMIVKMVLCLTFYLFYYT